MSIRGLFQPLCTARGKRKQLLFVGRLVCRCIHCELEDKAWLYEGQDPSLAPVSANFSDSKSVYVPFSVNKLICLCTYRGLALKLKSVFEWKRLTLVCLAVSFTDWIPSQILNLIRNLVK
jgi:hypothetical protein